MEDPNSVRLVALEIGKSIVFHVHVSELDIKYCACGTLYKFSPLEMSKINKLWGSYPNFHMEHPILIRPMH